MAFLNLQRTVAIASANSALVKTERQVLLVADKIIAVWRALAQYEHILKVLCVASVTANGTTAVLCPYHRVVQIKTALLEEQSLAKRCTSLAAVDSCIVHNPHDHTALLCYSIQFLSHTLEVKRVAFVLTQIVVRWRGYGQIDIRIRHPVHSRDTILIVNFV